MFLVMTSPNKNYCDGLGCFHRFSPSSNESISSLSLAKWHRARPWENILLDLIVAAKLTTNKSARPADVLQLDCVGGAI